MVEKHRHREFIGYQLYSTQRSVMRSLEHSLAPFGITASQWNMLNQLEDNGAMGQKRLAELLKKEPATIARSVDRLVVRGLVSRVPDPHDRRANIIELTVAGSALLSEIEPVAVAQAARIAEGLGEEELEVFFDVLDRVKANAEAAVEEEA